MKSIALVSLIVYTLILSSCRQERYIYAVSKLNTPALQKKGDTRLNTSFSFGNARGVGDSSVNLGFDVQGAYAITNHFAVMASYYSRNESDVMDGRFGNASRFTSSYIKYRRHLWELGAGYFATLQKGVVFNVYAGAAFGKLAINDEGFDSVLYTRDYLANTGKYFIQPGITFFNRNQGSFNANFRFMSLLSQAYRTSYAAQELAYFKLKEAGSPLALFLIEPSFGFQLPLIPAKWLNIEYSLSWLINHSSKKARGWNMSIGLTIDPVRAFKSKKR